MASISCDGSSISGVSKQRLIEPARIANMVTYLASPLASATTGGALRVDGGYVDSIVP